ncbi:hypothetical protein PGTUg99_032301 [Puccinia graminis f. sp. tritici]|uniref:Uncharacterized protein n=1 Tax=Puccinia graminis f. sp. tritici TaxID=56615 RepID=A0A5B0RVH3_PUCGR|nr:hypothetical protein PGTUg99_032301 [Puccinia graminis f. sp. tritici]
MHRRWSKGIRRGYPPAGADGPFSANRWRVSGYPKGYPPSKGSATDRLEGSPSGQQGTCTSSTGRVSFQSTRYLYLNGWKGLLPVNEVHVPRRLEGHPSSRSVGDPLEGGYPRIPAAADGYPPAGAGADADA